MTFKASDSIYHNYINIDMNSYSTELQDLNFIMFANLNVNFSAYIK
jgi:hypothetical protein